MYELMLFAERLSAPEGPVVAPGGWIMNVNSFTLKDRDWPFGAGDITATHVDHPLRTHVVFNTSTESATGIPAALAFGPDGCLYVADEGRRAVIRVTPEGKQSDFITHYRGERLNGPNDMCFDPAGNLFFTDPWGSSLAKPIGAVYGYCWNSGELHQVHSGLAFPNGILVRDGRVYAAETLTNTIWAYEVTGPGQAANPARFCTLPDVAYEGIQGPDGMAFDEAGAIYCATVGAGVIYVIGQDGALVERIETGDDRPTNVCFGGPGFGTLYITLDSQGTMVAAPIGRRGYQLPFCPSSVAAHPWAKMLNGV